MTDTPATTIVFLLFPGITQLDFTAPAQALSRMPGAVIAGAAASRDPIMTDSGFAIVPTHDFGDAPQADIRSACEARPAMKSPTSWPGAL